jgi:hypothetical protein
MVLFWPILAPKYEVPKLNTQKYVTLQKKNAKIEHCEFYVVINKTAKTLITCLFIFIFSIGNCHFNDI